MFHYGVLGIAKTADDVRVGVERVLKSGFVLKAFNCEMVHAQLALDLLEGKVRVHVPIAYPLGNETLDQKLVDLEYCAEIGVKEDCVCLHYGDILSHEYKKVEDEVASLVGQFEGPLELAFVIQATLLSDPEIVDVCKAIQRGGGSRVKVNTGYGWGTSPEEVALIRRVFGYTFDVHPSGNIRTLDQVEAFLRLGVRTIHTLSCFEIIDEYVARRTGSSEPGYIHVD